jgi:hypothetical protein
MQCRSHARVISPEELRDEIMEEHRGALGFYEDSA